MQEGRYRDSHGSMLFIRVIEAGRSCLHLFTKNILSTEHFLSLIPRVPIRSKDLLTESETGRFCLQELACKSPHLVRDFFSDLPFFIEKIAHHLTGNSKMVAKLPYVHLGFFVNLPKLFNVDDFIFLFL